MPRWASSSLALAVALASGCAFEDGRPWAVAEVDLTIAQQGNLAEVEIVAVELELETSAASPESSAHAHDHGGDDEETSDDAPYVLDAIPHGPVVPNAEGVPVDFEECTDDCRLPLGELHAVRLLVEAVTLDSGERVELDQVVTAEVGHVIDRDHPGGLRLSLSYTFPEDLNELVAAPLSVDAKAVPLDDVGRLHGDAHGHEE